ncbi:MAG: glycosyltransferase family 4 protein [Ruminococcaceae bacterium]|nr:glycosyltransferase family 4 protein [Oscillospiraceae bacterium]
MKLHIISTINGLQNEGMRNVATHLSKEFEKNHIVTYSKLKDVFSIIKNGSKSDVTIVFARLIKSVYFMLSLVRPFLKKICVITVQPVSDEFSSLNKKKKVVDYCLTLCKEDAVPAFEKDIVSTFDVGINTEKFKAGKTSREELCEKLNLPKDKTIVLHVGHCSKGRFLEEMLALDKSKYHCVVVASGMFSDENTIKTLQEGDIDVRFGFVKNIENYYNCADVYFFPTKSSEFVISVPLSVMEALSCGTPVVAYKSFEKLSLIKRNSESAVTLIEDVSELENAVYNAKKEKRNISYLLEPKTWAQVSNEVLEKLQNILE